MHHKSLLAMLISGALLVGCGSSDDETITDVTPPDTGIPTTPPISEFNHQVTGLAVYQGALSGATVCADLNKNLICDTDNPIPLRIMKVTTKLIGKAKLKHPIII
jgi:hypothetical protein